MPSSIKRYKLISCEILYREVCYCVSQSRNVIDIKFMPKGLHDIGTGKMAQKLQDEIDKVEVEKYNAILLIYGLCNNGTRGLRSKLPLVISRAHDCITLLFGSKEKYLDYFNNNPGTYFKSTGWVERDSKVNENDDNVMTQLGMTRTYQKYVEKYGEENAKYIMETMGNWLKNYTKYAYIDNKIGNFDHYKRLVREEAKKQGWEYEEINGSIGLIMDLVNGNWDSEKFVVAEPGGRFIPSNDNNIITLE